MPLIIPSLSDSFSQLNYVFTVRKGRRESVAGGQSVARRNSYFIMCRPLSDSAGGPTFMEKKNAEKHPFGHTARAVQIAVHTFHPCGGLNDNVKSCCWGERARLQRDAVSVNRAIELACGLLIDARPAAVLRR